MKFCSWMDLWYTTSASLSTRSVMLLRCVQCFSLFNVLIPIERLTWLGSLLWGFSWHTASWTGPVFFQFFIGLTAMVQHPFVITVYGDLLILRWNVPCCGSQYELSCNGTQYFWPIARGIHWLLGKGDKQFFPASSVSNHSCSGPNVFACVWLIQTTMRNVQGTVEYPLWYSLSVVIQVHEVQHVLIGERSQCVHKGLCKWCFGLFGDSRV